MSKWQPIETAPKDGTPILVYYKAASCSFVHIAWYNGREEWERAAKLTCSYESYEEYEGWWFYRNSVSQVKLEDYKTPTHWMPLPELPNYQAETT